MSSVVIYFDGRILNLSNLSLEDAEALVRKLDGAPGMTTIYTAPDQSYIVNRANIDYVEVRL
jgi:hypothetical protein